MAKLEDVEALLKESLDKMEGLDKELKSSRAEREALKTEVDALRKEMKKSPEPVPTAKVVEETPVKSESIDKEVRELADYVRSHKVKTEETEKKKAERIRVKSPSEHEEAKRGLLAQMLKDIQDERS